MEEKLPIKKTKIRTGQLISGCCIHSTLGDLNSVTIRPNNEEEMELTGKIVRITIADRCLQLSVKELEKFKDQLLAAEEEGMKEMKKVVRIMF